MYLLPHIILGLRSFQTNFRLISPLATSIHHHPVLSCSDKNCQNTVQLHLGYNFTHKDPIVSSTLALQDKRGHDWPSVEVRRRAVDPKHDPLFFGGDRINVVVHLDLVMTSTPKGLDDRGCAL